jgi:hypothetical protein
MYSARLQALGYWLHLAGLAGLSAAAATSSITLGRAGCAPLAASVLTFLMNAASILSHLWRRQTERPKVPLHATITGP